MTYKAPKRSNHGPLAPSVAVHRRYLVLACALIGVLALGAIGTSTALAEPVYVFQHSFNGGENPNFPSGVSTPIGVAIDQASGDVYVADLGHGVVDKFDSSGVWLSQIVPPVGSALFHVAVDQSDGSLYVADLTNASVYKYDSSGNPVNSFGNNGVLSGLSIPYGVAVDASGNLYVFDASGFVDKFDSSGSPDPSTPQIGAGFLGLPLGGTVDSNGNVYVANYAAGLIEFDASGGCVHSCTALDDNPPASPRIATGATTDSSDNVYVSDSSRVAEYDSSGAFVLQFGADRLLGSWGLAINNSTRDVYVADSATNLIDVFAFKHLPDITVEPASNLGHDTAKLTGGAAPDPGGGGDVSACHFEYVTDAAFQATGYSDLGSGGSVPCSPAPPYSSHTPVTANLVGLTNTTNYHYRLSAANEDGTANSQDQTFTTAHAVEGVTTGPASNVTGVGATLTGSFTGDGQDTHYYFEYGADNTYGHTTAPPPGADAGSGTGPQVVPPMDIGGLEQNQTIHYRLVASNSFGTDVGQDETVTTARQPTVSAFQATNVTADTADLKARINPHGFDTTYRFEYGTTPDYGADAPAPDADIGSANSDQAVSVHLTGLQVGATYHFRVVAQNDIGTTTTEDQAFNFYPETCPNDAVRQQTGSAALPDCRAYELVSAENTGNALLFPATVPFSGTATNPSRLAYGGAFGTIPGVGQPTNNVGDLYVATRTNAGWKTKYVGLPASQAALSGGPPWTVNGELYEADRWQMNVLSNQSLSKIVDWNDGYYPCNESEGCQGNGSGQGVKSSNAPYVWDSTTGSLSARWPTNLESVAGGEHFNGSTAASADLSHFVFSSDVPFIPGTEAGALYDNDTVNGTLSVVSLDSANNPIQVAPVKLSSDGSHILMSGAGQLYMRVNDDVTYDIAPGQPVTYVDMTQDGAKVYFTSTSQLIGEDTDTSTDLYMWSAESAENSEPPLTLVSKGNAAPAGNSDSCSTAWTSQCGVVPIGFHRYTSAQGGGGGSPFSDSSVASSDGDIYFLSPERLDGSKGLVGQQNLYDYRNGSLQFVAALDAGSHACTEDQGELICSETAVARMNISPDDSHMAFLTASRVTAYDNQGHSEVYRYTPSTGDLVCASCLPSGDPPTSDVTASRNGLFMTNDGRTFFLTKDPLVPQDTNQGADIYEFVDGRPRLISSGTASANEVFGLTNILAFPGLVGVSADGTDVYFSTFDVLVGQDRNGQQLKIYDARAGGGFPFQTPAPPCAAADECHGAGSTPPMMSSNGTGSELGDAGNVPAGHKKSHRRKRHHKKAHQKRHRNG